jgi:hypothetical protein
MKATDILKALALALGIMVVNVAISFAVVAVYSIAVEPGHPEAFYQAAAQRIAPWSSVVFGAPLFFLVAFWNARRDPERRGLAFAACIAGFYGVVDVLLLFAAGATLGAAGIVTLSLTTKLAGPLLGATLGKRKSGSLERTGDRR